MKRFVVGDLHGSYLALIQVLERSGFDYDNDLLITIGDIVDGWSDSFMVVEELLKIKNRIDIVGNHDDWFNDFIIHGVHPDSWSQGGLSTAQSYAKALGIELLIQKSEIGRLRRSPISNYMLNLISSDIPKTHADFFKYQNRYYKDGENNIFVHGGFIRTLTVNNTPRDTMMWDRKLWDSALSANSTKTQLKFAEEVNQVFIGHTTTLFWDSDKPMKADKVWNIDTGAGGGGKLTIMNVDTNEYFQSDLVPDLYPDDEHNLRK